MYATHSISGAHLPDKMLCLTYDDGPGTHTLAIAQFLYEQQIRATFFVVGKYAAEQQPVLARLQEWGHIIGNHTYDHPDLPYYVSINGDLQNQLLRTEAVIKPYTNQPVFFRAPYGKWSPEVANELNSNLLCAINHIGPIHWDIAGIDCYYWQLGKTMAETVESYRNTIRDVGKGIVVMHDEIADMDIVKPLNQTLELTRQLIPILKAEGYRFVGIDEVVALSQPLLNRFELHLKTNTGQFINLKSNSQLVALKNVNGQNGTFTVEELKEGKVALRGSNEKYLCLLPDNTIAATAANITPQAKFDLIPVFDNRFLLRTYNGNFFLMDTKTNILTANAKYMRLATIFIYQPLHTQPTKKMSLQMKFNLWKKRLAFIRSKLLSS